MFLDLDKKPASSPAVIDDRGGAASYGELCAFCNRFPAPTAARSVVFVLCENCLPCLGGTVALLNAGRIPLLLSASIDAALLQELIETYAPAYLYLPQSRRGAFPDLEAVCAEGEYVLLETGFSPYPVAEELAFLLCTSGSTGSPKLVRHSLRNLEKNAANVAEVFSFSPAERGICDLPMQYTMGLNVIFSHLYAGAAALLCSQNLMSADFWRFVKEERGTNFTGVPASYEVLDKLRFYRMDLPDLHTLAEGGGRLTDDLFVKLAAFAAEKGKRFCATFGTTETSARCAFLPPALAIKKTGSIGRAIPPGRLTLIEDDGTPITKPGVRGELQCEGPHVTLGYALCRDDLQKGDEFGGVYRTGDIAYFDEDGCFYIVGRKKRFLKLYGLRVGLDECERILRGLFDCDIACAGTDRQMRIYITDPDQCEAVRRAISEKTGILIDAFAVTYKESLPRNDAGKILYAQLES